MLAVRNMHPIELTKAAMSGGSKGQPDGKKFRLRAVSTEFEVYDRYFRRGMARTISLIQYGVCVVLLLMVILQALMVSPYYGRLHSLLKIQPRLWTFACVFVASFLTLMAANKSSYFKLHLAMTFHIASVVVNYLLVALALTVQIKQLRSYLDTFNFLMSNWPSDSSSPMLITEFTMEQASYFDGVDGTRIHYEKVVETLQLSLGLTGGLAIGSLLQGVFSFIVAIMTGRAICYGRSNLEGKLFEVEAVGSHHRELGGVPSGEEAAVKGVTSEHKIAEDDSMDNISINSNSTPPPYQSGNFNFKQ